MKIGRNEPCPCGSNKKYKKCCLPKQATAISKLNSDKPQTVCNVTGELFHPVRLHYKVFDKEGLKNIFNTMKCIDTDTKNERFVWLYEHEAKNLNFEISYKDIPKRSHPIVIGSFFQSKENNDEILLDVRSPKRAEHAVQFFDKYIDRKYAEVTHASLLYRFIQQSPKNIDINFDKFFPPGHADKNEADRNKLNEMALDENTLKDDVLDVMDALSNRGYPETDKVELFYYEDGLSQLTLSLRICSVVAIERMNGNENVTRHDIIGKITTLLS